MSHAIQDISDEALTNVHAMHAHVVVDIPKSGRRRNSTANCGHQSLKQQIPASSALYTRHRYNAHANTLYFCGLFSSRSDGIYILARIIARSYCQPTKTENSMLLARVCSSRKCVPALSAIALISSRLHFALLSARPISTMADAAAAVSSPPVAVRHAHAVKIGAVAGENRGPDVAKLITPFITKDDDLFWLRDDKRKSAEVLDHLRAENAYTASKTAALTAKDGPVEKLYAEFKSRLKETDAEVPYNHGPFAYYSRTEEGKSYPIHCRHSLAGRFRAADGSLRAAEGAEEVVLDENAVAAGNKMCDIHDSEVSPDHSVLAYSVDFSGWEEYTIRFKRLGQRAVGPSGAAQEAQDAATGAEAEAAWSEASESITKTSGDFAWGADGSTVFYLTLDGEHRPHRVWRHILGAPQAADECIFEEPDERFWLGIGATMSEDYLLVEAASKITAEVRAIPLTARAIAAARAAGAPQAVKLDVAPVAAAESDDEDDEEEDGESGEESGSDEEDDEEEAGDKAAPAPAAAAAAVPSGPRPPLPLLQLVAPRREGVLYEVEHARGGAGDGSEDAFVILTNAGGAVNFKLCVAPTTAAAGAPAGTDPAWVDVLPHSADLYLTGVNTHARFWAISGRQGGYEGVWLADGQAVAAAVASANAARAAAAAAAATALQLTRLPAREDVYVLELGGGNAEYETNTVRFRYSSPVCPTLTCEYAVYGSAEAAAAGKAAAPVWPGAAAAAAAGGASGGAGASASAASASSASIAILKQKEVPNVDPSLYRTTRVWATAADGTRIPVSIVYRPDAHKLRGAAAAAAAAATASPSAAAAGAGASASAESCPLADPAPMLLYAYGSYGISIDPYFSAHALSLADRGVVYAIAHIRGGGEMGRGWYEPPSGGKLGCKWNTFRDYIAAAEHLIASGWTAAGRIGAQGGSAGGLLMGVVANERPDLWGAVLAEVPFVGACALVSTCAC